MTAYWFTALPKLSSDDTLKIVLDVIGENPEICLFGADLPATSSVEEIGENLGGTFYNARKAIFVLNERESALVSQVSIHSNFG